MHSLGLILGHLIGDYIFQNDWMASNKANPHPGEIPIQCVMSMLAPHLPNYAPEIEDIPGEDPKERWCREQEAVFQIITSYNTRDAAWWRGHLACTVHCVLYTLAVWACSWQWMPWWGLLACFLIHWPIDRFRLAAWWMKNVSGQTAFATGPLAPWSIVVVDNTWHLATLYVIGLLASM